MKDEKITIGKPKWRLFLDDFRDPPEGQENFWVVARSYEEAVKFVETLGMPIFIMFDHDLDESAYAGDPKEKTGYDFAKWLVEQDMDGTHIFPEEFNYFVHSQNTEGKKNIEGLLNRYFLFKEENK